MLDDFDAFVAFLAARPGLLDDVAIDELRRVSTAPGYGPLIGRAQSLLSAARSDPAAAWAAHVRAREVEDGARQQLERLESEIEDARACGDFAAAIRLIDRALPIAREIGFGLLVCELLGQRGTALCKIGTERRASELDEAIEAFDAALDVSISGEQAARWLMQRGLAFAQRVRGDPRDNAEQAVASLRAALDQLQETGDDELRAMVQTNLAVALLQSHRDHVDAMREAAALCRAALSYRRPETDADNWAYSQINLGYVLRALSDLGEGDHEDARAAYAEVVGNAQRISDRGLVGIAHQALGRLDLARANRSPEEIIAARGSGELDEVYDNAEALEGARKHLEAARRLTDDTPDRLRYASVLDDLSNAQAQLGDNRGALSVAQEALRLARPATAPETSKKVAWRVGNLLAEAGDWNGAADAYRDALEAADFIFHACLDTSSRNAEIRNSSHLYRWAAYAFAQAGQPMDAALALDAGRGRELQRRLGLPDIDDAALAQVPAGLRAEYLTALRAFGASPMDGADALASRGLQEALAAIRQLPGLSRFGRGPDLADIRAALEPSWPLAYVNPTPHGTLILVVWPNGDVPHADATFVQGVTGSDVFMRLIAGDAAETGDPFSESESGSYLIGISGQGDPPSDFGRDVECALAWLGDAIARPLLRALARKEARGVTMVLCGPIGSAPLHAATWQDNAGPRMLGEVMDVRYAPSAVVCAAARRRAEHSGRRSKHLVAIADPRGDLPAARPEVEEISALFQNHAHTCATGVGADIQFLQRHAAHATHLHLACHARGGLFDTADAAILLASGPVAATEVTATIRLNARLVAISACQSAQSTIAGLAHEDLSIATAMLASGSACAIASLWSVDDLPTALLMTRLYQEMLVNGHRPPEALLRAQRWLRDLTAQDEQRFLQRHPSLAAEYRRRADQGDPPGRRGKHGDSGALDSGDRPYARANYWAPFIAVGV